MRLRNETEFNMYNGPRRMQMVDMRPAPVRKLERRSWQRRATPLLILSSIATFMALLAYML